MSSKNLKKEKGMAFIVLILIIIVILIFLSFVVVMITGENGILVPKNSSSETVNEVNETSENEATENTVTENETNEISEETLD